MLVSDTGRKTPAQNRFKKVSQLKEGEAFCFNFSLMFAATTNSSCGSVEHSPLLGETLVVVRDANLAH